MTVLPVLIAIMSSSSQTIPLLSALLPTMMNRHTGKSWRNSQLGAQRTIWPSTPIRQRRWSFGQHHHLLLTINSSEVERVQSTKYLGIHLTDKLTNRDNTSAVIKKAQQRLHFLRRLKKVELPIPAMTLFYRGTVESLLTYCISSWFGSCTAEERPNLSRIVRTAEKIIGVSLPQLQDIYTERCVRRAGSILKDCTHPFYGLFSDVLRKKISQHKNQNSAVEWLSSHSN